MKLLIFLVVFTATFFLLRHHLAKRLTRGRVYGRVRDDTDKRDFIYKRRVAQLPKSVDLRSKMPPVWDQGQLGSCTAFALTAAIAFIHGFIGSQLWLYYKERSLEHSVGEDSGAQIRDGVKVLAKLGLPPLALYPYDIAHFTARPPASVNAAAKKELLSEYRRLVTQQDYLDCLAAGDPFALGIDVYASFESATVARTGVVPNPRKGEKLLGGHAICVVGYYYDAKGVLWFIIRNSWSAKWGKKGYFVLRGDYPGLYTQQADAWVLLAVPQ